jgi:hypothetical protein
VSALCAVKEKDLFLTQEGIFLCRGTQRNFLRREKCNAEKFFYAELRGVKCNAEKFFTQSYAERNATQRGAERNATQRNFLRRVTRRELYAEGRREVCYGFGRFVSPLNA